LELADRLHRLPPSVVLIAIEAEACNPTAEISPSVRRALPKLYRQVLAEARARRQVLGGAKKRPHQIAPKEAE
jgi:hypothetical protein